ncbi:Myb family transcription factor IPN2 [Sesamum angolense]|uniref:Myb family transcription factor IPN2 n=1 Tax=Sesamum angolense TaxID=2727404 RepID=A0AAE2BNU6_9LAMI|nr:Myb family transcription factor IPN2 [Sesamum angolense]
MGSNRSNGSSKERLKWTKELHDLFEKAVNQIGGPDRATPKGILKAMAIPGLTIFHVKSHLQKYRMSVFTREEDHIRGKFERRSALEMLPNFSATSGAQLNEALLIQMEAQRRLNDHLEVQKSLKMKIEAQGRFLDKIMEEYTNRAPSTKPVKPYSPILSLPSLSEESDHSNGKEFESDSEDLDTNEMISRDEFQAQKRIKIQDNFLPQTHKHPSFNPDIPNLSMFSLDAMNNNLYAEQEMGFPWSIGVFPSPFQPASYYPTN